MVREKTMSNKKIKASMYGMLLIIFLIAILPAAPVSGNNNKFPGYRATEKTFLLVTIDTTSNNLRGQLQIPKEDTKLEDDKIWSNWKLDFIWFQILGLKNVKGKELRLKINFKKSKKYKSIGDENFVSFEFIIDGNIRPYESLNKSFLNNTLVLAVKEMKDTPGTIEPKQEVPKTHTVKKGETLYSIAKQYNLREEDLMKWNDIKLNNQNKPDLKAGVVLKLYPPEVQTVKPETKPVGPQTKMDETVKPIQQQTEKKVTARKIKDQSSKEIEIKDFSQIEKLLKGGGVFCYDENDKSCGIKKVEEIKEGKLWVHKNTKKIEFQNTFLKGITYTVSQDNKIDLDLRTQSFTPVEKIEDQEKLVNGVFYRFVYENENLQIGIFKKEEKSFTFTYPRKRDNIKLLLQMDGYKEVPPQDISNMKESSIIPMVVQ
jgi:LysM repeat protein